jgi:hypothetical protein
MRAFDDLPRLAELSLKAARQAGTLALSVVRTVAEAAQRRRPNGEMSGWKRRWEPPSSRPVGEPPPPPSAPRRPVATTPATPPPATRPPVATTPATPPPAAAPPVPPPSPPAAAAPPISPPAATPPAPPRAAPPPPAEPEPEHVDTDAVVVAESADAGAADGAGPEIHVAEPWEGYSDLNVKDITKQLATASPATLAVVRLYESGHRNRRTVLQAVERRLAATDS